MSDPVRDSLRATLIYLRPLIPSEACAAAHPASYARLGWLVERCLAEFEMLPVDKLSRWIGYVQGVLACHGLLDMSADLA